MKVSSTNTTSGFTARFTVSMTIVLQTRSHDNPMSNPIALVALRSFTETATIDSIYQGMSDEWVLWLNRAEISPIQPRLAEWG